MRGKVKDYGTEGSFSNVFMTNSELTPFLMVAI